jgi:uncharacterized protein (DUF1778 family)
MHARWREVSIVRTMAVPLPLEAAMARTKDARFEARLDPDDDELLTWAAAQIGMSKSAFVMGTALERARALQAGEELTQIARDEADNFLAWLDQPPRTLRKMRKLAAAEPFEQR